ncbi:hypothetical protein CR3_1288 [Cupriavidus gilardii CR3]|uniref:TniQ family protein n=1 Tax=Cupriavidus gilardii TaxID=82541 RepID=A0ABY4VSK8_9BURK|nr:TniQ family protein [Cupriavidus gilardii]ALD90522.1 hypothetical protein CR3_1288 [Cupriavidus gilardii CR3]USE77715.1 TniQ family protein [Cupriavidus gilardii]UXC34558.1 TniQ family protein [Cupriavidus gilardii]
MAGYPSVNWWPRNLRPYESALSFVARFCALNGVPARAGTAFLGVEPRHPGFISDDDVARVSSLLGEDPARLADVLQHALDFRQCGTYAPPPAYSQGSSVRYCAACAQQGYHSYLHEVPWLTKCPVHLTALTTVPANRSGNIGERRLGAFKRLMQGHCAAWPHFAPDGFPTREPGALLTLAAWVHDACDASKRMQAGELWRSEAGTHRGAVTVAQALGQLHTLAPLPTALEPLLADRGDAWVVHQARFPRAVSRELARLGERGLRFDALFAFYKDSGDTSDGSPAWYCQSVQQQIRQRHGTCGCRWERVKAGFGEVFWIKTQRDELGEASRQCPFEVALQDLELDWGRRGRALPSRLAQQEMYRFLKESHAMRDAGVLSYKEGAQVSPDGYLYLMQRVWPCCEWNRDSPLLDLFRTAARWEIDSEHRAITRWLDDIEAGSHPSHRQDPLYCVRLRSDEQGASLLHWRSADHRARG